MTNSTGKTIIIILVVVILALFLLRSTPFFFAPLGIIPQIRHMVNIPDFCDIKNNPFGFIQYTTLSLLGLALLVVWIFLIIWVYRDAERRGMNGLLWALLVFIGHVVGFIIYLIIRSDSVPAVSKEEKTEPCPKCEKPVEVGFTFCPHCGAKLHSACPKCKKPVEEEWSVCPHCGTKLK